MLECETHHVHVITFISYDLNKTNMLYYSVADPGFPVGGGANLVRGGAPTPNSAMFRKICVSKRKTWDPWGLGSATVINTTANIQHYSVNIESVFSHMTSYNFKAKLKTLQLDMNVSI